jgi:hypothetical protein
VAIGVAANFLSRILLRDDVTEDVAEDIFSRLIVGVLAKRDSKVTGRAIVNYCTNTLKQNPLAGAMAYRKLALLDKQIKRYAVEFNPIIQSVPSLLKGNDR